MATRTRTKQTLRRLPAALTTLTLLLTTLIATLTLTSTPASAGSDTYPAKWSSVAMDSVLDDWREYNRECTSYGAWMLHSVNGFEMPFNDNAVNWGTRASALGYAVNATPAVGAIYWKSSPQHVAWVEAVNSDNTVTVEDYNSDYTGHWGEHTYSTSSASGYIHFKDLTTSGGSGGSVETFYLRNSNTPGNADITIQYGFGGVVPIVGDWDGNGTTTLGVWNGQ